MSDTIVIWELDPAHKPKTPRYNSETYFHPDWSIRLAPRSLYDNIVYYKNNSRTLVAAHEDSFKRRLDGLEDEKRAVAFIWPHKIGVLKRLLNTTEIIPGSRLNYKVKTNRVTED